jgi:hypothetical protein
MTYIDELLFVSSTTKQKQCHAFFSSFEHQLVCEEQMMGLPTSVGNAASDSNDDDGGSVTLLLLVAFEACVSSIPITSSS